MGGCVEQRALPLIDALTERPADGAAVGAQLDDIDPALALFDTADGRLIHPERIDQVFLAHAPTDAHLA
ncbi:hypothetical protein GCM10009105_38480 [Dokdonella soli]|uniref:Uncharacterized protein n=1 Tax=Dokdonella soli TaxID=529810 RepID=A0ABN1J128_9GAMM